MLHHVGQAKHEEAYLQVWNSKLAILVHQQLPLGAASVAGVLNKGNFQRYQLLSYHLCNNTRSEPRTWKVADRPAK